MTERLTATEHTSKLDRKNAAVWIRENLNVHVDFEDWDGLTDNQVRTLVIRMYGFDTDDVVSAMEEEHAV